MLALPAGAAWAADPVTIPSGQNIVDDANVLGSRKGEVQTAIQTLLKDHKYNLYVVTVNSFDNPSKPEDWGKAVATQKSMGKADVLLAISTAGQFYFATDASSAIRSKQSNISQNAVTANLAGGKKDYAQAAPAGTASIPVRPITARIRLNFDRMCNPSARLTPIQDESASQNSAAPPRVV
jgi:hypothetical protein